MDGDVSIDPLDRAAHLVENRVTPHDLGVARFVPPQTRSEEALHGVDVARLERRGHAPVQLSTGVLHRQSPLALPAPSLCLTNRAVNGCHRHPLLPRSGHVVSGSVILWCGRPSARAVSVVAWLTSSVPISVAPGSSGS